MKRKRSLALKVRKNGELQVSVPQSTGLKDIESFIISKYKWIQKKQLERDSKEDVLPLTYGYGDKHWFKGKEYPLQLIVSNQSKAEIANDTITVYHRKNSSIKNVLNKWYKQQSIEFFTQRTQLFVNSFNLPEVRSIKVRNMKARWGSCSTRSEITYNIHLIKAEPECIDYVIIHELCHLLHPNHGSGFYKLQTKLNPYWKLQKKSLNDNGYKYIQL